MSKELVSKDTIPEEIVPVDRLACAEEDTQHARVEQRALQANFARDGHSSC
jgi:hypothetical protein